MKRWIVAVLLVVGLISGCSHLLPSKKEATEQAYKRWDETRAKVLCGVAAEHLKVGQLSEARSRVREALAMNGEYAEARLLLAKIRIEQGEYSSASAELTALQTRMPESDEVTFLLGVAREKEGKLEDALASYRRTYALNDKHLSAIKAAAEVLVALGRTREAQLQLDSYLAPGGEDPGTFELAGRLAAMQGQHAEAVAHYEQALLLDPDNADYREDLARESFLAGRYDRAVELLDELKILDAYKGKGWLQSMLGDCYMELDRPFDAYESYEAAGAVEPGNAGLWANLAKAALGMSDWPRAILAAQQALRLESGRPDATLLLGYALIRGQKVQQAVDFLTTAVARHAADPTIRCLLGRAHAAAGRREQAGRCYREALEIAPGDPVALSLLQDGGFESASR